MIEPEINCLVFFKKEQSKQVIVNITIQALLIKLICFKQANYKGVLFPSARGFPWSFKKLQKNLI